MFQIWACKQVMSVAGTNEMQMRYTQAMTKTARAAVSALQRVNMCWLVRREDESNFCCNQ
jgi:hypothetical protein